MEHWSVAHNITIDRCGDSPWNSRRKKGHFKGLQLPFGCTIDFLPSPVHDTRSKFEPRAIPGVFLGYRLGSGGIWRNEFYVVSLVDLAAVLKGERKMTAQIVREVVRDNAIIFPAVEWFAHRTRTLEGAASQLDISLPEDAVVHCDPPAPALPPRIDAPQADTMDVAQVDPFRAAMPPDNPPAEAAQADAGDPLHPPIELPPGYESHSPYTGLPPHCVPVPGGHMVSGRCG
jgi:hypothetical protein